MPLRLGKYTEFQWMVYAEFRIWVREQILRSTGPHALLKEM